MFPQCLRSLCRKGSRMSVRQISSLYVVELNTLSVVDKKRTSFDSLHRLNCNHRLLKRTSFEVLPLSS